MLSRRSFVNLAAGGLASRAQAQGRYATAQTATEWSYTSSKRYKDPFSEVELDVIFEGPAGEHRVPAFWAGEQEWRVRYAPPVPGRYRFRTVANDTANSDLHGRSGVLEAAPYEGTNALYLHGGLRVAQNKRYLEHRDGTPFFWLADTWWMGLCKRLHWPDEFQQITSDRVSKGFTVVQIVAGLYPDMPGFDPRGANEAGFPWEKDYARINPAYFDAADLRIQYLVHRGIVPCVVGCWGYYLPLLGLKRMKQHWRYLVARWGAYPVVWCLAGEGSMPYYLTTTREKDEALQKQGWTEMARYVRDIDPYRRPITIHPSSSARNTVEDPSVLDFDMLQTGHGDRQSIPSTVRLVTGAVAREPRMPVINGRSATRGFSKPAVRKCNGSCSGPAY